MVFKFIPPLIFVWEESWRQFWKAFFESFEMFIILKPPPAVLAAIAVLTAIAVNGGESVTSLIFELEKF